MDEEDTEKVNVKTFIQMIYHFKPKIKNMDEHENNVKSSSIIQWTVMLFFTPYACVCDNFHHISQNTFDA